MSIAESFITHRVENQVPALAAYNAFLSDAALRESVQREGGGWAATQLTEFGALAGGEMMALGFAANENQPRLRAFDRNGERIDEVEFHPAYHRLMQLGMQHGVHALRLAPRRDAGRARRPRRAVLHALPGRERHLLPAHHDLRRAAGAAPRRRARGRVAAADHVARLRPAQPARIGQDRLHDGHGHDREAGRLRRAREHDTRAVGARPTAATSSSATSGSSRRR